MSISVAMCTYNGESYLIEQLESIINQTMPVDEIVICDDGSTDSTCLLVEQFIKTSRIPIKFIKNGRNIGFTKNFEKAICLCSGDIIFLSDQDDIWFPDKVEKICMFFNEHPDIDYVFTNAILVNHVGVNSFHKTLFDVVGMTKRNKKLFDQGYCLDVVSTSGKVTGATTAVRASFIPYCIPFPDIDNLAIHDGMMSVCAAIRNKIAYIDHTLIKYRIHGKQSIGLGSLFKRSVKRWELADSLLMWHERLIDRYLEEDLERLRFVYKRFWAIRSYNSLFLIANMFLRGEYRQYYSRSCYTFYRDLKGIFIRKIDAINGLIHMRRKERHYFNT